MSRSAVLRREADHFPPPAGEREAVPAFVPESIPVNESTAPPAALLELVRAGIDHLMAKNGRDVRS